MNMAILLRLLFAHVISDFVIQSDDMCNGKQGKTKKEVCLSTITQFYTCFNGIYFCCRLE